MKRLNIMCDFGGQKLPFHIYVGEPEPTKHPLQHQANWISSERGGSIPSEVMDSFEKLHNIAKENNMPFEDLCVYAMGQAGEEGSATAAPDAKQPIAYRYINDGAYNDLQKEKAFIRKQTY